MKNIHYFLGIVLLLSIACNPLKKEKKTLETAISSSEAQVQTAIDNATDWAKKLKAVKIEIDSTKKGSFFPPSNIVELEQRQMTLSMLITAAAQWKQWKEADTKMEEKSLEEQVAYLKKRKTAMDKIYEVASLSSSAAEKLVEKK